MKTRGLVVGKFYPPHRGHKLLIDTALAQADEVHVVVCARPGEHPPADVRARWIREIHPGATVHLIDDRYDPNDSRVWAAVCTALLGFAPEVVFTSESYGEPFAAHLGCRHVLVDRQRAAVPVSGTAVRADPFANWDFLDPPVRGFYARRVVLIGAESTGKTTLAADLAAALGTVWVPEYGREYWEQKAARGEPDVWAPEEFVTIARGQCEREDAAARRANRVLVCDTDAFATRVWHRRYMGSWSAEVDAVARAHRRPDLYLLTDINTPFFQDGTRDGERIRDWMHQTFVNELTTDNRSFVRVLGTPAERLATALDAINRLRSGAIVQNG
ncbi:Trifunctional NAD biosynthesis/regulator protein NadR [Gemmata obscuriglobus]|uniref:Histidine kinase n=1 Tax=Gemmata obscuriglobus TaxID=114 RepID=A0A2Z3HA66_9BACT|nr:AAA family ATPase [Gemmata obscuriglobus]AWM38574.1 histidine kinase [Gemmata obscuriglobus]QEG28469.1 Trifunctional NAD biosynthesis/regulator protein NadR [Gemmata obscuriglobus]VTS06476.1 transcriptional regulator : Cytidyltransferase-related enzyme OS=Chamaesiphon minutus PCC 6605 GN=Cha6605_1091 PE=4 SV=1: AAA_28 [Gemmata obscuriglobus UQM 2246]